MKLPNTLLILTFLFSALFSCTQIPDTNELISLRGDWKYHFGDLQGAESSVWDDSSWKSIELPTSDFVNELPAKKGVIWFRYQIERTLEGPTHLEEWFFQAIALSGPDQVYFNGVLIGETGRFPPNPRFDWISRRNYRIPPEIWEEGTNTIAIKLYVEAEAWIAGPLELWPRALSEPVAADYYVIKEVLPIILTVILLIVAGVFLVYTFKRPLEKDYRYFSMASFALALLILPQWHDRLFPSSFLDSRLVLALGMGGLFLFAPLMSLFLANHLELKPGKLRFSLTLPLPLLGAISMLFLPGRLEINLFRNIFFFSVPIFMGLIFVDIFRAFQLRDKKINRRALTMLVVFSLVIVAAVYDLLSFSLGWLNMGIAYFIYTLPILVFILSLRFVNNFINSLNENEKLRISFHRFVPEALIRLLGRHYLPDVQLGDAVEKRLSVVFTDIRNFTTLSESLEATEVFNFLNGFLGNLVPAIRNNNGFVDKYLGDGVLALFPESCDDATQAIFEMIQSLEKMNQKQREKGLAPIKMGIGVAFGDVIVGTVGETHRLEGTAVADTVNLAARLESLTKFYQTEILVTQRFADESNALKEVSMRLVDKVCVKGKSRVTTLMEVLMQEMQPLELWAKAMESYFGGDFARAKTLLEEFQEHNPQDHLTSLYLGRCETNLREPEPWPGYHLLDAK